MQRFFKTIFLTITISSIHFLHEIPAQAADRATYELVDGKFVKVNEPDPATPEGKLLGIRKAIAKGKGKTAQSLASDWISKNPSHPKLAVAYLLRGDAKSSNKDFYKALRDYEFVIRAFPGSPEFEVALDRELKIASAYVRGVKRKIWGMRILPADDDAEELLIRIQERSPGTKIAERAGIELADYYYRDGRMNLASIAYDLFLQNYPQSQWREHATKRQIDASLATFKGPRFDATGLINAKQKLLDYRDQFPAASERIKTQALLTRIDESLAERTLFDAKWYDKRNNLVSARYMYMRVIKDHPGSSAARKALARLQEIDPKTFSAIVKVNKPKPVPAKPEKIADDKNTPKSPDNSKSKDDETNKVNKEPGK